MKVEKKLKMQRKRRSKRYVFIKAVQPNFMNQGCPRRSRRGPRRRLGILLDPAGLCARLWRMWRMWRRRLRLVWRWRSFGYL
jgi:hypothetical protein